MRVIFYYRKDKSKFTSPPVDWIRDIIIDGLTIGKEYVVDSIYEDRYLIENDYGVLSYYSQYLFTKLEDIRNDKLNQLGIETSE